MLTLTLDQVNALLAANLWPFLRILALFSADPLLGNRVIPQRVRLLAAVAITVVIAPILPPMPKVEVMSVTGLWIGVQQVMIGLVLGATIRVVFVAVELAGQMVGLQMGLGFATLFDPQNSVQIPVVGQLVSIVATLSFLAFNGHLLVLGALAESFSLLPVSATPVHSGGWVELVLWAGQIFVWGLLLSLPLVAALLIANVALGMLTRAAPQLNIFAVGFPLTLAAGFLVLYLSIPLFIPAVRQLAESGVGRGLQVLRALH